MSANEMQFTLAIGCDDITINNITPVTVQADFRNLGQQLWWEWHDGRSTSPSTAYEGCQAPCICVEWMWELFDVSLEP